MTTTAVIRAGTAGWSIPRASARQFDTAGTHLERYSRRLSCAEINSSFYRPHAPATYAKWRDSTPPEFRFAVKLPRTITHERCLANAREPLVAFLDQIQGLAEKKGPILIQLPPSLDFDESVVTRFFELVRGLYDGAIVCEPRHATWFTSAVDSLLMTFAVARVAADPPPVPSAADPGGWAGIAYYRLHGSPRKYWSRYDEGFLTTLATAIRQVFTADEIWCVFDNTASGAAAANALELSDRVRREITSARSGGGALRSVTETVMPFKSQAQRRKFAQLLVEGKISNETFEEWNRETGRTKLPERVPPKAKSSKAKPSTKRTASKNAR